MSNLKMRMGVCVTYSAPLANAHKKNQAVFANFTVYFLFSTMYTDLVPELLIEVNNIFIG